MVMGSTAMPIAFFGFVQEFLMKDRKTWLNVGLISYVGIQIANALGFVITDAEITAGLLHNEYGSAIALTSISWVFFIGFSAYDLIAEFRRTKDSYYRNRIKYLLVVIIVIFLGSLTNASELQVFPIDITFNVFSALLVSYAILRFQLLDINVVIRKGLLYSIPTALIGTVYFLIISLAFQIFQATSDVELFVLSLVVAIVTALVAKPFLDKAQSWIDKIFFREKYDLSVMMEKITRTAAIDLNFNRLTNMVLTEVSTTLHIKEAAFFLKQEKSKDYTLMTSIGTNNIPKMSFRSNHPIPFQLVKHDQILTRQKVEVLPQFKALWARELEELESLGAELFIPLKVQGELVGILTLGPKLSEETYSHDDQTVLITLARQIAVAIDNARLYELARREINERKQAEGRLQLQLKRMGALHTIDTAITSSVNLEITLRIILDMITSQLNVDAAAVLLILDSHMQKLEYVASRGFHTTALQHTKLNIGQGLAGQAAINRTMVHIEDLNREATSLSNSPSFEEENFVTYYGIPLIARGKIKGVLEILHRSPIEADPDWIDFLKSLAAQTAIAVDNSEMFNDLQRSNVEMNRAYVTTLGGWSRALELRDRETEGHTQRVTIITLELASELGMSDQERIHVHRGALLHDIGKMGIPDTILLKPGPLNEEEWEIMRQHPTYAFELLSTIPFLRPALDIPHYHHEKWDGTGYPLGLKGEEIPLAARIFAIVDVYDALVSDRPYRLAWSREDAVAYIAEQREQHFDPQVVDAFFKLMEQKTELFDREIYDIVVR
jgi:HD-GYP domain-containing protein (c-di-GMP phosphodiesterase class II)